MSIADAIFERLAAIEQRMSNMNVSGKVTDVDPEKQLYRQTIGVDSDGKPVKSPWVPYSQHAGAFKAHIPPTVGQTMMMLSNGDMESAGGVPLTWSDGNKSPGAKGDENVLSFGPFTVTLTGDVLHIKGPKIVFDVGGSVVEMTSASLKVPDGMRMEHGGKNVGRDHNHGGIRRGGDNTDAPNA